MPGSLTRLAHGVNEVSSSNPLPVTDSQTNRELLLSQNDLVRSLTWLDHGTSDARISTIVYSSAALGGSYNRTLTLSYTLSGGKYRLDSLTWS